MATSPALITVAGISPAKIKAHAHELLELERQIKDFQDAKSAIYKGMRKDFNRAVADGLKTAVSLLRMVPSARAQKLMASEHAAAILQIIEAPEPASANSNAPSRAQEKAKRTRAEAPAHASETGEILEEPVPAHAHAHAHEGQAVGFEAWRQDRERERVEAFSPISPAVEAKLDKNNEVELDDRSSIRISELDIPRVPHIDDLEIPACLRRNAA